MERSSHHSYVDRYWLGQRTQCKHAVWLVYLHLCHMGYILLRLFKGVHSLAESLLTWDVLFLLPVMWVGPVWAPILLSLTMIVFTIVINHINANTNRPIGRLNWALLISGSLICIVSFCIDFIRYSQNKIPNFSWTDLFSIEKTFNQFYIPADFPVAIFGFGLMLIVSGIIRYYQIHKISSSKVSLSQLF